MRALLQAALLTLLFGLALRAQGERPALERAAAKLPPSVTAGDQERPARAPIARPRADELKALVDLEIARAMASLRERLHAAIDRGLGAPCPHCGHRTAPERSDPRQRELQALRDRVAQLEAQLAAARGDMPKPLSSFIDRKRSPAAPSGRPGAAKTKIPRWGADLDLTLVALSPAERRSLGLPPDQGWRVSDGGKAEGLEPGMLIMAASRQLDPKTRHGLVAFQLLDPRTRQARRLVVPFQAPAPKPAGSPVQSLMRKQIRKLMREGGGVVLPRKAPPGRGGK